MIKNKDDTYHRAGLSEGWRYWRYLKKNSCIIFTARHKAKEIKEIQHTHISYLISHIGSIPKSVYL